MKHYGYVYIWYDTKNKKYLIGSHHGQIKDGYKTSTGGIHVKNIFKFRPLTMKFRVLEYNTTINDRKHTLLLEQKWLNMRPNIAINKKYYNKTNRAGGGFDRYIQIKRIKNGTHHFLGGKIQKETNTRRIVDGTHNFLDKEIARKNAIQRIKNGTHHFLRSNFNKRPFKFYKNNILLQIFTSKVEAVNNGWPPGLIDKIKKHNTYVAKRGSYSSTLQKYNKGDIFKLTSL